MPLCSFVIEKSEWNIITFCSQSKFNCYLLYKFLYDFLQRRRYAVFGCFEKLFVSLSSSYTLYYNVFSFEHKYCWDGLCPLRNAKSHFASSHDSLKSVIAFIVVVQKSVTDIIKCPTGLKHSKSVFKSKSNGQTVFCRAKCASDFFKVRLQLSSYSFGCPRVFSLNSANSSSD